MNQINKNNRQIFLFIGKTEKHRKRGASIKESLENMKKKLKEMCILLTLPHSRITWFPFVRILLGKKRLIQHSWALHRDVKAQDTAIF